jgi:hypothetical protein
VIVSRSGPLVAVLLAASALPAQTSWQLRGGDATVRITGAATAELRGPRDARDGLPAGDYAVHFGADAAGKPGSLAFAVPTGAGVQLASEQAPALAARIVPLDGDGWRSFPGALALRVTGSGDDGDYRVDVEFVGDGPAGVVARCRDEERYYALLFDGVAGEVRLERRLGPDAFVVARAAVAATSRGAVRRLGLQAHGFRLQAWLDDAIVLQAFDGALTTGQVGLAWRGEAPEWRGLRVAPPATPRSSVALVAGPGEALLHAAVAVLPGHHAVLELGLDRPHALVPRTANGCEVALLLGSASPQVALDEWRGTIGPGRTQVEVGGALAVPVRWPDLPSLRSQAVLVRLLFVSPDGEACVGSTPAVPLRF